MKLKTKILLTLIALFAIITILGVMGSYFLDKIAKDSVTMMRENNNTLAHTRKMSLAISEMVTTLSLDKFEKKQRRIKFIQHSKTFERHLKLQTDDINEEREKKITNELKNSFDTFRDQMLDSLATEGNYSFEIHMHQQHISDLLNQIYDLNKTAIDKKQNEADGMANNVILAMIVVGFLFFGFALFSLYYFPDYITKPIIKLTESIKQIAQKNYSQRLEMERGDEFGEMAKWFNLMAKKLEEYESINVNKIVSEKQRIEIIISQMKEAIIGLDGQKRVLFINPTGEKLLNIEEEKAIGKPAHDLIEEFPILETILKEVLEDKVAENGHSSTLTLDKENKNLYFDKDILVVQTPDSSLIEEQQDRGFVVILKNITELKEMDLAKTNFMATLSHELKTPISAITMSVNLLEDNRIGEMNEEQIDLTKTIKHNTSRLLKMVNEILDISKIETGNVQLNMEEAEPQIIVARALSNVKTFIVEKNIDIQETFAEDVKKIQMDVLKTTGVMTNFLTNAIRYSEYGKPIKIDVTRKNGSIEFLVTDFGTGMPEEDRKEIFQRYRRAKNDKTKGTGLGLAISKEFIEAQGGKIWAESTVGEGSKFGFTLPAGNE